MLRFLFGGGWWTLWYLYLHVWWLGIGWLGWWLASVEPGAGPQGGEAAFLLLLLVLLGLTVATGIDALLYASACEGGWAWRRLGVPALALLGWGGLVAVMVWLVDAAATVDASLVARRLALAGFLAAFAMAEGLNLYALWVFRGR